MKTILIVEDDLSSYLYLAELLEGKDVELIHASNGQEALDICKNNSLVDLVLMDIRMPVMNGYTATKLIKAVRPDLPIIAQTAYAVETDMQGLIKSFDDCIAKPINRNILMQKLSKFISSK